MPNAGRALTPLLSAYAGTTNETNFVVKTFWKKCRNFTKSSI